MYAKLTKRTPTMGFALVALSLAATAGCHRERPVTMAPPMSAPPMAAPPVAAAPPGMSSGAPAEGAAGVFNWRDVPVNQQIPITRGAFDQGGYQLYAQTGETIVVPFENQNMYVMKFGMSQTGGMYFLTDGTTPTLFVPRGGYLQNASAQGAKWYPFSNDFRYERPVYIGIAPTWAAYTSMGWYPGMMAYGGYWGYRPWYPGFSYAPMIGLNFNIGGRPYYGWNSYSNYYRSNPYNRVNVRNSYNYAGVRRSSPSAFGSGRAGSGSFGRASGSSGSFGRASGSSGSFGRSTTGSSGSFGRSTGGGSFGRSTSGGSFGRSPGSSTFGTAPNRPSSGFGSSSSRPGGSFGSSSSGFGRSSGSTSGGSFGRSGSSGFGGGSSSFGRSSGGSSFGRSSGGGSFGRSSGGGRRR